jgi:hypothetical protein
MQCWCIVACSMPYKPMLTCRKVCYAFMYPFTEENRWNLSAVTYLRSVMKGWKELRNYYCNCDYIVYLRRCEIAPTMNLRSIYSIHFLLLVAHIENVTSLENQVRAILCASV